eukprot:SM000085S23226  [mRNA]  locus=s85:188497:194050:+ [translate_table: standard]
MAAFDTEWGTSMTYEQSVQLQAQEEESRLFRNGPPPGDVAEVEAFCRIYRLAEELHAAVMEALKELANAPADNGGLAARRLPDGPERGDISETEEKIISGLAKIGSELQTGRLTVLGRAANLDTSSRQTVVGDVAVGNNELPPLAVLRQELQGCCKELQWTLEVTLPDHGEKTQAVKKRLERLKNVTLDAGFPRLPGAPNSADIPNFAAVKLRPFRGGRKINQDEEVAFWRGGQVTSEGLEWLLAEGFRSIVDMRAVDFSNQWIKPAIEDLAQQGTINYVRIPVKFGTAPSKEQVEQFARLVADSSNQPLYLHSQGGVGRACAMVSRWREYVTRAGLENGTDASSRSGRWGDSNGRGPLPMKHHLLSGTPTPLPAMTLRTNQDLVSQRATVASELSDTVYTVVGSASSGPSPSGVVQDGLQVSTEAPGFAHVVRLKLAGSPAADVEATLLSPLAVKESQMQSGEASGKVLSSDRSPDTANAEHEAGLTTSPSEADNRESEFLSMTTVPNVFESQRPGPGAFSKQSMRKFMKSRKVAGASAMQGRGRARRVTGTAGDRSAGQEAADVAAGTIAGPAGSWALAGPGIPRVESHKREGEEAAVSSTVGDDADKSESLSSAALEEAVTGAEMEGKATESHAEVENRQPEEASSLPLVVGLVRLDNDLPQNGSLTGGTISGHLSDSLTSNLSRGLESGPLTNSQVEEDRARDIGTDDEEEEIASVTGDMCASTTGVVRVQSRKKAEMYLVRTDGFSCTRERVKDKTLAFTHPSTQQQMLMWKTPPKTVLLLKKLGSELLEEAQAVASWLHHHEGMNVVVEPEVHDMLARVSGFGFVQTYYNQDTRNSTGWNLQRLYVNQLFCCSVLSLFLQFENFEQDLERIVHGNNTMEGVYITLRMRLKCELMRDGKPIPGKIFDVLNEVVVDRGSSPYLCKIECYERNRLITKVQADGVLVATPTGSTAYSTAAGGSMVHPNVPCMLFTPICPHSLSFRPVILPDSALFELKVPKDARNNAWVSFDGKKRQQLSKGDSVRICMSEHPMPTVNKSDQTDDWFRSLVRCLNWNERLEQKALSVTSTDRQ